MVSSEMNFFCAKVLHCLIFVGLILSDGNATSQWMDKILTAIKILPGDSEIVYNALLLIKNLRKKERPCYSIILKHVLCKESIESISEPVIYLKIIMLFRRLKIFFESEVGKVAITTIAEKIKPPSNVINLLSIFNIDTSKMSLQNTTKQLLEGKFPNSFYKELLQNILNNNFCAEIKKQTEHPTVKDISYSLVNNSVNFHDEALKFKVPKVKTKGTQTDEGFMEIDQHIGSPDIKDKDLMDYSKILMLNVINSKDCKNSKKRKLNSASESLKGKCFDKLNGLMNPNNCSILCSTKRIKCSVNKKRRKKKKKLLTISKENSISDVKCPSNCSVNKKGRKKKKKLLTISKENSISDVKCPSNNRSLENSDITYEKENNTDNGSRQMQIGKNTENINKEFLNDLPRSKAISNNSGYSDIEIKDSEHQLEEKYTSDANASENKPTESQIHISESETLTEMASLLSIESCSKNNPNTFTQKQSNLSFPSVNCSMWRRNGFSQLSAIPVLAPSIDMCNKNCEYCTSLSSYAVSYSRDKIQNDLSEFSDMPVLSPVIEKNSGNCENCDNASNYANQIVPYSPNNLVQENSYHCNCCNLQQKSKNFLVEKQKNYFNSCTNFSHLSVNNETLTNITSYNADNMTSSKKCNSLFSDVSEVSLKDVRINLGQKVDEANYNCIASSQQPKSPSDILQCSEFQTTSEQNFHFLKAVQVPIENNYFSSKSTDGLIRRRKIAHEIPVSENNYLYKRNDSLSLNRLNDFQKLPLNNSEANANSYNYTLHGQDNITTSNKICDSREGINSQCSTSAKMAYRHTETVFTDESDFHSLQSNDSEFSECESFNESASQNMNKTSESTFSVSKSLSDVTSEMNNLNDRNISLNSCFITSTPVSNIIAKANLHLSSYSGKVASQTDTTANSQNLSVYTDESTHDSSVSTVSCHSPLAVISDASSDGSLFDMSGISQINDSHNCYSDSITNIGDSAECDFSLVKGRKNSKNIREKKWLELNGTQVLLKNNLRESADIAGKSNSSRYNLRSRKSLNIPKRFSEDDV
ncbi:protein PF14_0175-like [Stegodyphus dumicola]|uniref:protein PF14_0175-like n=1 Tax=Stegodyphus dumicola TaxID=202533 RepID=UPI0015AA4CA0|nr:protein PF14_0175-like [Stegodyphus dumicola]XP_035213202.1 protein PF14_0175-like [Stegodyphus dumicola]